MNFEAIFHFFNDSSPITYIVLIWLSLYFILSFSILFARMSYLAIWKSKEKQSLERLLLGEKDISQSDSILRKCTDYSLSRLEIYKNLEKIFCWSDLVEYHCFNFAFYRSFWDSYFYT